MEWGWVCLLLSKQKSQKCVEGYPAWCEMSSGYIGVGFLKQLLGCQPLTRQEEKTSASSEETTKENGSFFFFFPEEIDI